MGRAKVMRKETRMSQKDVFICDTCSEEYDVPFFATECENRHVQSSCPHPEPHKVELDFHIDGTDDEVSEIFLTTKCNACNKHLFRYAYAITHRSQEFLDDLLPVFQKHGTRYIKNGSGWAK